MTARFNPALSLDEETRPSYSAGLDEGARISGVAPANDANAGLRHSMLVPTSANFHVVPAARLRLARLLWMPSKNITLRFRMLSS
jgi:hypothetical protein